MSKNTFSYRTALVAASQCLRESGNCLDAFANKCKTYGGTVVDHLPRETALSPLGTPTDWSNLYLAIAASGKLNIGQVKCIQ